MLHKEGFSIKGHLLFCAAVLVAVVCSILMRDWPNQSGLMIASLLAVVTGMVLGKGMKQ